VQQLLICRQTLLHFRLPLVYVDKIRQSECGDQRNDLAVKPSDFCNSLIFGEKRLQKRASGFLLNKDGDLFEQPVGSDRSSELEEESRLA